MEKETATHLVSTPSGSGTILRLPQLRAQINLSKSSIYKMVADGTFPAPVRLGKRAVGWLAAEIENWITKRITASREAA